MQDFHPLELFRPSPVVTPTMVFLRRPSSCLTTRRRRTKRASDRTQGLLPALLDITPVSLRRTGRARLRASSATGSALNSKLGEGRLVRPAPFRPFGNGLLRVSFTHIHSASKVLLFRRSAARSCLARIVISVGRRSDASYPWPHYPS